jgi:hypothetical protein
METSVVAVGYPTFSDNIGERPPKTIGANEANRGNAFLEAK